MEMRRAVLDLKLAILGIRVDILTLQEVDQDKTNLPLDQVNGRIWVGREVHVHSPFPLVVPVAQVPLVVLVAQDPLVSEWMIFSQTFLEVALKVVSLVLLVVQPGLNLVPEAPQRASGPLIHKFIRKK